MSNPVTLIVQQVDESAVVGGSSVENIITLLVQKPADVVFHDEETFLVSQSEQGLRGPTGDSAYQLAVSKGYVGTLEDWLVSLHAVGGISTDAGNAITKGTDLGLYVPDLVADPVAYYILAKS